MDGNHLTSLTIHMVPPANHQQSEGWRSLCVKGYSSLKNHLGAADTHCSVTNKHLAGYDNSVDDE